ncbi:MAG: sigma 54-interacting transcriptional regulator [Pirellulales bacterium]
MSGRATTTDSAQPIDFRMVEAADRLFDLAATATGRQEFVAQAAPVIREAVGAAHVAVVAPIDGRWTRRTSDGSSSSPLPLDLLADALDRGESVERGDSVAVPLAAGGGTEILLLIGAQLGEAAIGRLAGWLARGTELAVRCGQNMRRVERLETILRIAQQWHQADEMEPLLVEMAEAATQLFGADRASIFLWDRPNKTLVGRPALGLEGNELRIADDRGVVGQVVQRGEAMRVGPGETDAPIDRKVDAELGYQTETILCVPLTADDGEVLGAFELLNKRAGVFTDEDQEGLTELAKHAAVALENTRQLEDLVATRRALVEQASSEVQLIGASAAIEVVRSTVARVAPTDLAILILGENGTGKEVVSRMLHYASGRREQPLLAVNCASLAESLLESELFGHEKGAFTDAHEARAGKFEQAAGGTLFLDEIGDMSLGGQAKLLRVLEEKIVVRVGGSTPIHTDVRVIAATNQNLAEMVAHKRFREDLYYRLNVVTLDLPPLRARGDDLLQLAEFFLQAFCRDAGRRVPKFSAAARKRLLNHRWPGNVRELRNLMERLAYLLPGDRIEADDLAFTLSPRKGGPEAIDADEPLADATRDFQVRYIEAAILSVRGNMSDAAERLGLHRSNLYRKMRQLGMATGETDTGPTDDGRV